MLSSFDNTTPWVGDRQPLVMIFALHFDGGETFIVNSGQFSDRAVCPEWHDWPVGDRVRLERVGERYRLTVSAASAETP
jgi:hypothetical protein